MGAPEAVGLNIPDFENDVPRVPKYISRWGSTPNHFLMGSQMKLWTLSDMIGVPEAIRWTKFYKGCTKFCEGCTKGSDVRLEVGIDP